MKGRNAKKRIIIALTLFFLLLGALAMGTVYVGLRSYASIHMDMSLMEIAVPHEPSVLFAYDPSERALRSGELHPISNTAISVAHPRIYTPYEEIPADLVNAFVSIEDKRFWQHDGVDVFRSARAGMHYLLGNASFGGSTITQQLVKNLTGNTDHSVRRKLTEICCALDLEKQADKRSVLEAYLNVINLAEGCYGVGAAANLYFSKSVSELTLPECAAIAAITNNPARYDPLIHPENNLSRRNLILREMAAQGYITESERDEAIASVLCTVSASAPNISTVSSWYADMVVADVIRDLQTDLGYTYTMATMLVYQGGLRIETAVDEELQRIVEAYYEETDNFPLGDNGAPQSSVILMDPYTGDILAVAGAIGKKQGDRLQNYATDTRRPAGSCIKPVSVYAPALAEGLITWATIYDDEPITQKNGTPWPANADGIYRGRVTVGQAVAHSLNPVSVRILEQVGLKEAFSFAHDALGINGLIPAEGKCLHDLTVSSLALGQQSLGVTVRELTAAYTAFADGIYRAPVSYHRVLDREGKILLENKPADESSRVLSVENAALMTRLLMMVTKEGTAARYMTVTETLGVETAGKTGTTQNNCDRWFVGYTPRLLAGVWMGYDYPVEMKGIRGNRCVSIWDDLMTVCESHYRGHIEKKSFDIPEGLVETEFCPLSGSYPNEYCDDSIYGQPTEHGWFIRGTEPHQSCKLHQEPPVILHPDDPTDPERIPNFPNDLLPKYESRFLPPETSTNDPWYARWFSFFSGQRRRSSYHFPS